jgi:DNA replication protein DnaC
MSKKDSVVNLLDNLKLKTMKNMYLEQDTDASMDNLTFDERLDSLLSPEWTVKVNNKRLRIIRQATLNQPTAAIENIKYHPGREIDRKLIKRLASCEFIKNNQNVIILGHAGAGKTFISNALANEAINNVISVKYIRLPDLLYELKASEYKGIYLKTLNRYAKFKLLILDEWLLYPPDLSQQKFIFELVSLRYDKASTIVCSQHEIDEWKAVLGEGPLAASIVDRLQHALFVLRIKGDKSLRDR